MLVYQRVAPAFFRSKLVRRFAADGPKMGQLLETKKQSVAEPSLFPDNCRLKRLNKNMHVEKQHISQSTVTLHSCPEF
jgi:hypothetical protein